MLRRRWDMSDLDWGAPSDVEGEIDRVAPTVVVSSAHKSEIERQAMACAARFGAKSIQVFDTWYDYAARSRESSPKGWLPDFITVINDQEIAGAGAEGLPVDRLVAVGNPAWEAIPELGRADKAVVLFISQPISADEGMRFGYTEVSAWAEVRKARIARPDLFARLLFAPHPRMNVTQDDVGDDVTMVRSARAGMEQAGTVIGMFSTALVEAHLAGRNTLTIQPNAKGPDRCWLSRNGIIDRCGTADDMIASLSNAGQTTSRALRQSLSNSRERLEALILERGVR